MNKVNKVLSNIVILFVKIIITMFVSLYTVPIVLRALGVSDYGLYNLVAGIILMLTFLNVSMTLSTQRYMSVTLGSGAEKRIRQVFNASVLLHLVIGIIFVALLEISSLFLFNGFLNIDPDRINAAKIIFQFLIISTFFSIMSVPFEATINAQENMLVFSVLDITEYIAKFFIAISLSIVSYDKLIYYVGLSTLVAVIIICIKVIFCFKKYASICTIERKLFDRSLFQEMFYFAGWNTFGSLAVMSRNQGIAIILNIFLGTVVNAAYGIANQISSVVNSFTSTLQKSINPQLMKSEGENNRERMMRIAFVSSKFSVLILCLFAIPIIIEIPYILKMWLKDVPQYTIVFCRIILISSIITQFSSGIASAIQSVGRIKTYQIVMGLLLILNIPLAYMMLNLGNSPNHVLLLAMGIEIIALLIRLIFAKHLVGLVISVFFKQVILPIFLIISILFCTIIPITLYFNESFIRLFLVAFFSISLFLLGSWYFVLSSFEQNIISTLIKSLKNKFLIKYAQIS